MTIKSRCKGIKIFFFYSFTTWHGNSYESEESNKDYIFGVEKYHVFVIQNCPRFMNLITFFKQ